MTQNSATAVPNLSPGKRWAFRLVALLFASLAGFFITESALRWRQSRITRSDVLEPGMVRYDSRLGWSLTPGWTGRHTHQDYAVRYTIGGRGLRQDTPAGTLAGDPRLTLVVGDSFTFGLGVNDDQTFVHHLQAAAPAGTAFLNGSVPGYSTDQQALLLEQLLPDYKPVHLVLVVYLGNDLFDNQLAFPMQVSSPKPFFAVTGQGVELQNSPVPQARKPRDFGNLMTAVWGSDPVRWPWRTRWEQKSELFRLVSQSLLPTPDHRPEMTARYEPARRLFDLLLERIAAACARRQVRLTVVTLAGRSFVDSPASVSAQYQDVFREQVLASARRLQLGAIDLAGLMREEHAREGGAWFHPNEGHLNATGHQVAARILGQELSRR